MATFNNGESLSSVRTKINDAIDKVDGNASFSNDISVSGNITVTGTVDGVDIAARDGVLTTTTTTANAALPVSGGTMTGDVGHGDNVKATFGASADLQVYHDGSNSYIKDAGTGFLNIGGYGSVKVSNPDGSNVGAVFNTAGAVNLNYNGSTKLATTTSGINVTGTITADDNLNIESSTGYGRIEIGGPSGAYIDLKSPFSDDHDGRIITTGSGLAITGGPSTGVALQYSGSSKLETTSSGINVTGTVEADGLTVDGDAKVDGFAIDGKADASTTYFRFQENASSFGFNGTYIEYDGSANELIFGRHDVSDTNTANDKAVMSFQRTTGDISFYEDTGTTAKFFWDASAEALGIGTTFTATGNKLIVESTSSTTPAVKTYNYSVNAPITSYSARVGLELISYQSVGGSPYTKTSAIIANSDGTVPSEMQFWTKTSGQSSAAERMRIDSSGNLEMTGGGSVGWANFTFVEESGYLYVYNGSTKIMRVDASGNAAFAGDVEANATL